MRRPISPNLHGVLDYITVAGLLLTSRSLPLPGTVRRLLQTSACLSLLYSVFTRYRFGLLKVVPMEEHLALDLASAASLFLGPEMLGVHEPRSISLLRGLGVFETVVPLLTRTQRASERALSSRSLPSA